MKQTLLPALRTYQPLVSMNYNYNTAYLISYYYYHHFCPTVKRKELDDFTDENEHKEKRAKIATNTMPSSIEEAKKTKNNDVDAGAKKDTAEENEVMSQVQGEI